MLRTLAVAILFLLLPIGLGAPLDTLAADVPDWEAQWLKTLSKEDRRDVYVVRKLYRAAGESVVDREAAVSAGVARGPHAAMALLLEINPELYQRLETYRDAFHREATALSQQTLGKNLSETAGQEIAGLRTDVLALRDKELTALQVRQINTALLRLQEIFAVDPAKVLADSESLQQERARLREFGKLWEACTAVLYAQIPDGPNKVPQAPKFEQYLSGEEEMVTGMAAPMYNKTNAVNLRNVQLVGKIDPADPEPGRAILALNLMRNLLGLDPLAIDPKLCYAARMSAQKISFTGDFRPSLQTTGDTGFGVTANAEVVFPGAFDGFQVTRTVFRFPTTVRYGMGNYTHVGVGRTGPYFSLLLK